MGHASLWFCVVSALQGSATAPAPQDARVPSPLARIALIGASASAGFNVKVSLADALEAQIAIAHTPPVNFAAEAFFIEPGSMGEAQVTAAAAIAPTLVVAADFLFWFGYGEVSGEAERLENLDMGLELLEGLKCPLILSHFPDMTPAIGKMLLSSQVPAKQTLEQLNARVDAWARARGHVAFVAMPEFIEKLRAGNGLMVGGFEFKAAGLRRRFMQSDDLHPTAEGLGMLARLCVDAACEPSVGAKPAEFKLDLPPILESLRKLDETRGSALRVEFGATPPKPAKQMEIDRESDTTVPGTIFPYSRQAPYCPIRGR